MSGRRGEWAARRVGGEVGGRLGAAGSSGDVGAARRRGRNVFSFPIADWLAGLISGKQITETVYFLSNPWLGAANKLLIL